MSKVIILTERNNLSKYSKQKNSLFESRLQMISSRKRNFYPLSITNTQSGTTKNSSSIKYLVRHAKEKEKYKLYNQSKKISNLNSNSNSNNNIFNTKNNKKIYNSTFNNFAKNIKQYIINKTKENNKIYNSNKTFMNKSLNNSMVGKSMIHSKYLCANSKIKNLKKMEDLKIRKKILSLSNSISKSTKNNTKYKHNKKKKKESENNKSIFHLKNSNNNLQNKSYINYSKTIIASNYSKLPIKEYKNKNSNINHNKKIINNKSISKLIYNSHTSFNSYNNIKLGKTEDNTKDSNRYLNNGNKIKLKKEKLNLKKAKDKLYKYNKYNINNNQKIYRNNYDISCQRIHKTTINSLKKKNKKKQNNKELKTKINKSIKSINNIDLIQINLDKNKETINSNNAPEEIRVNKLENAHCLSENSKININNNSETENDKNEEEEEEEDSNILSIDDVQDIIKYYNFNNIKKKDNYLFYFNDYKIFSKMKKELLNDEFFNEPINFSNSKTGKKEIKSSNKKKLNNKNLTIYYRNFGTFSPVHIINSDNNNHLKK